MFGFLLEVSEDRWAMSLTFSAVRNLAIAVEEVNETFLASKITLRSRMFSLFASEPQGKWVKKVSMFSSVQAFNTAHYTN